MGAFWCFEVGKVDDREIQDGEGKWMLKWCGGGLVNWWCGRYGGGAVVRVGGKWWRWRWVSSMMVV